MLQPDSVPLVTDSLGLASDSLSSDEELEEEIKYNARDSIRFEVKNQKIFLYGVATVEFSGKTLTAERIEIDNKTHLVSAYGMPDSTGKLVGTPVFKDGAETMSCEKIIYNTKSKKGKIYNMLTEQAEMLVQGGVIMKDSNDVMYIKDAKCIPCQYADAVFYFRATKAKIIPDDKIVTGPMFVEIAGMKTPIGLPFGFFPNVKNKSKMGLIIPSYGQSPTQGFYLQNGGVYIPINNKTDMEIRGDIYTGGSWGLYTTNRYHARYKYTGVLNLSYKEIALGEKEIPYALNPSLGYRKLKNFAINWVHTQDAKRRPNERFSANVNVQSGLNNKYNPVSSAQYITNTFYSNVSYGYTFKNASIAVNARHNQNTQTHQMEMSLPEFTLSSVRFFPFKNETRVKQNFLDKLGISYTAQARSFLRTADSVFFRDSSLSKIQYGLQQTIPISTNINLFKYFTLTPAANISTVSYMNYTNYHFDEKLNMAVKDTVAGFKTGVDANFSTNLTTKLFGDYYFKLRHLKQIRHLIIPTVGFTYHPNLQSDKLGFYKMVQTDTLGHYKHYSIFENGMYGGPTTTEGAFLTYNLNNNFEAKVRKTSDTGSYDKKVTLIQNLSISGSYNAVATQYNWSQINVTGRTKVWKNINLMGGSVFDPYATNKYGTRIDTLNYTINKKPVRYVSSQLAVNAGFNPQVFAKPGQQVKGDWNFNVNYTIVFNKNYNDTLTKVPKPTQQLNFNTYFNVTPNWKITMNSGFDFTTKKASYTSFSIYRDLRCWEAHIDWVPFGFNKRYMVGINLKTSALQSVRIPRQRQWYDNL